MSRLYFWTLSKINIIIKMRSANPISVLNTHKRRYLLVHMKRRMRMKVIYLLNPFSYLWVKSYLSHLYKLYGRVHTYTGIFKTVLSVWFGLSDIEVSKIQHSALLLRFIEKTGALSLCLTSSSVQSLFMRPYLRGNSR